MSLLLLAQESTGLLLPGHSDSSLSSASAEKELTRVREEGGQGTSVTGLQVLGQVGN